MNFATEKDLLLGLLALQIGLINQSQLVAAFQAWTLDKARTLADQLVARGDIDFDDRAAVEALVDRHIKKHGGDVEQSLAAIPAGRSTRESLARIGDPQIDATLSRFSSGRTEHDADPDRTANYAVGTVTSDGQRFRVLRPHAKGGLGAVFIALDAELHREVALKQILESHAYDQASRNRFLLEAEITGGLEHPGIVPVYGLGTYGDGRPYYAMRFIKGDSLKEAIDQFHASAAGNHDPGRQSLELRGLLRRFIDVCNAIDYAHSRGVLHRDIKPGNIIVGMHGETLVVDWGLAKATGKSDLSAGERTLLPSSASGSSETLPGSALGTPAYMSPEQAQGNLEALGVRSDVYGLGATLYCLLAGKPPFTGDAVEVIPRVKNGEFAPPRQADRSIDRALEAICIKAMALKPEDRYGTCRALADDVERWMADEPVAAWREPLARQARRWARRNRTAVAVAVVALVATVVGLGAVAGVQARANSALQKANDVTKRALTDTRAAQAETKKALAQSEESRKQAEAVSNFLVDAFRSPDPSSPRGRDVKVADVLDQASAKLDQGFAGSQATKGALLNALGRTYAGLGLYGQAVTAHTKARSERAAVLGHDHPDTLTSDSNLAVAFWHAGRTAEAIALHESTLKRREAKLGPDHRDTLGTRSNLALAYRTAGRLADSIALDEATLRLREAKLGPDHDDTLASRNNLANNYRVGGRLPEAIALHELLLKRREAKLGPDHPDTLLSRNNLANAYRDGGRLSEAITLHEAALKGCEARLGSDHPLTLITRRSLVLDFLAVGRTFEAIALLEATLKVSEAKLGPDHPEPLESRRDLAEAYESLGRVSEAEGLFRDVLARRRKAVKPDSSLLAEDLMPLSRNLLNQGRCSEAEPLVRELQAILATATPDDWPRYDALGLLGASLLGQGRYADAGGRASRRSCRRLPRGDEGSRRPRIRRLHFGPAPAGGGRARGSVVRGMEQA